MSDVVLAFCLQKSYFSDKGTCFLGDHADILKVRLAEYLRSAKEKNNTIYLIREVHPSSDKFFSSSKTHSVVGSFDLEIPEVFKPFIKVIIDTSTYNALYKTALESELNKIKPNKIYLVGLETHTFVMFTAEELRNRGYQVTLIEPLVASMDEYLHGLGVTMLKNFLAVDIEQ
jgi:nicotinamidase-related amidase